MKQLLTSGNSICLLAVFCMGIVSCSKDLSRSSTSSSTTNSVTSSTSSTIAVAVDSTASGVDSVYILQTCNNGYFRDTIAASALPTSITAYLDTTYGGFNFQKEYVIKDSAGTVGGYVVIISYNGKPVALLFSSTGVLVRVLEQRQAGDLYGNGWHEGGRYDNRDGKQRDTVALASLPANIQSYFSTNYPADTLLKAFRNYDSSYLVISRDSGVIYATVFTSGGTYVRREVLADPGGTVNTVTQTALPATALSYLSTSYPDYVFEKAFSLDSGSTILEYLVIIDANNTKYALLFDYSGALLSAQTIW